LQHFRSFDDAAFEFETGVNIIIGPNASGKTNLLESILVVAQGASYRGSDRELIQHGQAWTRLDAVTKANNQHSVTIKTGKNTSHKEFKINNNIYRRLQPQHRIPVVIFEPNQLQSIASSPELRRNVLDGLNE